MLLRYRYLQPVAPRPGAGADGTGELPAFRLVYAGAIPTDAAEPVEELLDRLCQRHASEIRPQGRGERPLATGDVLDLAERGLWRVASLGFDPLAPHQLRVEAA